MAHLNSTTTSRDAELIALRDEIFANRTRPDITLRDAAEEAIATLAGLLEYAAEWDAACAPPEPPTPAERKAAWHAAQGLAVVAHAGGYLVPSGTRAGVVHFVKDGQCTCEAGQHGRACWHASAVRQIATGKVAA